MNNLTPMTRTERVDIWSTALMVLMFVHTGVATLNTALEGNVSLLCGLVVAAGYIFGRSWLRKLRAAGHATIAWTALRVFETACVTVVVFLLCTVIAGVAEIDVVGYALGVLASVGLLGYRVMKWSGQSADYETIEFERRWRKRRSRCAI